MSDTKSIERSVTAHLDGIPYTTRIVAGEHTVIADEPLDQGGQNAGTKPHELLLGALASCIAITLKMYAARKEWDTGAIHVDVRMDRTQTGRDVSTKMAISLSFGNDLPQEQRDRLLQIAGSCPVHRTLSSPIEMTASLKD